MCLRSWPDTPKKRSDRVGEIGLPRRKGVHEKRITDFRKAAEPERFGDDGNTPFKNFFLKIFVARVSGHEDEAFCGGVIHVFQSYIQFGTIHDWHPDIGYNKIVVF